jgi:hypothetical protein
MVGRTAAVYSCEWCWRSYHPRRDSARRFCSHGCAHAARREVLAVKAAAAAAATTPAEVAQQIADDCREAYEAAKAAYTAREATR